MTDEQTPSAPPPAPPSGAPPAPANPEPPVVRKRLSSVSLVWLVPIVAAVIGAILVARTFLEVGPEITIQFATAEGLAAGKTEVRYKEVVIGRVTAIGLAGDGRNVAVTVQLEKSARPFAVKDTRFWVIRPRIGSGGISGLGTLLSGAYIGVDRGVAEEQERHFTGLETPPLVLRGEPGRTVTLRAPDLGSLDIGSPVYYHSIRVGRVVGFALGPKASDVDIQLFIEAPYQPLINRASRFWNVSGLGISLNAAGVRVDAQSLASVVAGGVAFETMGYAGEPSRAPPDQIFKLYDNRASASRPPDDAPETVLFQFDQSIRGLAVGAPVEFFGVNIGSVTEVTLVYDPQTQRFPARVRAEIYPNRVRAPWESMAASGNFVGAPKEQMKTLIDHGLRAQLRSQNLLTSQLYVAMEFFRNAKPVKVDVDAEPFQIATVAAPFSQIEPQVAEIVGRLNRLKIDEIGSDLQQSLRQLQTTMTGVQQTLNAARTTLDGANGAVRELSPQAMKTLDSLQAAIEQLNSNLAAVDAPLQRNVGDTLREMRRAAESLRGLTDSLQRHPESLLRGRPADPPIGESVDAPSPSKRK